jgi:thiol:disulfide interchange protein DsbD
MVKRIDGTWVLAIALGSLFAVPTLSRAQLPPFEEAAQVKLSFDPPKARRGQPIALRINVKLALGFHTYPMTQTDPAASSFKNNLLIPPTPEVIRIGPLQEPPFQSKAELGAAIADLHYYTGTVEWTQQVVVNPNATPGAKTVQVTLPNLQVCNDQTCFPPKPLTFSAPLTISDESPLELDQKFQSDLQKGLDELAKTSANPGATKPGDPKPSESDPFNRDTAPPKAAPAPPTTKTDESGLLDYPTTEAYRQSLESVRTRLVRNVTEPPSLLTFILQGVFWGLVSLVTPCVFPMIPITVSFFLKQSEKEHHRPLLMATVYCATIVIVLALAALLLLNTFRWLSINPILNFAMGGLFIFFALSLFGMYEIELPAGLARFTSSREGQGGLIGTVFMALTFTILSFACVAPFLGGFGGTANTRGLAWWEQALGGLAFSATFAAPFFVLALFPSLLKKMPKSGSWLNSVKVVMGFLELAAAFKFLRLGEIVIHPPTIFTYDLVLGLWIALGLLCGLYLLGLYRLPHDSQLDHLGVPRLMFAAVFLGVGFYLMPALFKVNMEGENQRPRGVLYAWIDAFILPDPVQSKGDLVWTPDLRQAVDELSESRLRTGQRRLIFIDHTGETCVNCRINERSVFTKPEIKELLGKYKLIKFYTDKIPAEFYATPIRAKLADTDRQQDDAVQVNLEFQASAFDDTMLPLYAILEPLPDGNVRIVGQWKEGKINDEKGFAEFLRAPYDIATSGGS